MAAHSTTLYLINCSESMGETILINDDGTLAHREGDLGISSRNKSKGKGKKKAKDKDEEMDPNATEDEDEEEDGMDIDGEGEEGTEKGWPRNVTKLEWIMRYVEASLGEKILRGLKTDTIGVLAYGYDRTSNHLSRAAEEADEEDGGGEEEGNWDHVCEIIQMGTQPDMGTIEKLKHPKRGVYVSKKGLMGDDLTALIVAIETINYFVKKTKKKRKIILLTDGESDIDWSALKQTAEQLNDNMIDLVVIGIGFDDRLNNVKVENKSDMKSKNEDQFYHLTSPELLPRCNAFVETGLNAVMSTTKPKVREVKPQQKAGTFRIGDIEERPKESIEWKILYTKGTAKATPMTMKKINVKGWNSAIKASQKNKGEKTKAEEKRGKKRKADDDDDDMEEGDGKDSEDSSDEEDLANEDFFEDETEPKSHLVNQVKRFFYAPPPIDPSVRDAIEKKRLEAKEAKVKAKIEAQGLTQSGLDVDGKPLNLDDYDDEEDDDQDGMKGVGDEGDQSLVQLEENKVEDLMKAYKYGSSLVPFNEAEDMNFLELTGNREGMELIGTVPKKKFKRTFAMGEIYYVYGTPSHVPSQVMFSGFINAMDEKGLYALVRWTKFKSQNQGTLYDPDIGILAPRTRGGAEYCVFVQVPFAEDFRNYTFPSLERIFNKRGKLAKEHKLLPTRDQQDMMDKFIESMSLMDADVDDDGNVVPWFETKTSYNPSIHNTKNAILRKMADPDCSSVPPPHPELIKYFDPPELVLSRSEGYLEELKESLNIVKVPPKAKLTTKKRTNVTLESEEIQLADILGWDAEELAEAEAQASNADKPQPAMATQTQTQTQFRGTSEAKPNTTNGTQASKASGGVKLFRSRLISMDNPLKDFKDIVSEGDIISTAISELSKVIEAMIQEDPSLENITLAIACAKALRKTCAEEEEAAEYNQWLLKLFPKIKDDNEKKEFLREIKDQKLGLISQDEVEDEDEDSGACTIKDAKRFYNKLDSVF